LFLAYGNAFNDIRGGHSAAVHANLPNRSANWQPSPAIWHAIGESRASRTWLTSSA
jgi:hypothetical protein